MFCKVIFLVKYQLFYFIFLNIFFFYSVSSWLKLNLLKILLQGASTDAILFLCYQKDLRRDTIEYFNLF